MGRPRLLLVLAAAMGLLATRSFADDAYSEKTAACEARYGKDDCAWNGRSSVPYCETAKVKGCMKLADKYRMTLEVLHGKRKHNY